MYFGYLNQQKSNLMKIYYFILTLFFCSISFAQSTISGSVKDSKNEPIPGANVKVVGEPSGTVTDVDGKFIVKVTKKPPFTIEVSSIGIKNKKIEVTSASQKVEVKLENQDTQLDEIVETSLRQAAIWDELKDRLDDSALGLSGGQQQRLCIGRTLAVSPDIILMDEPASALDPISTSKIEELIHQLKEQYTIIIVTHNMQQAARTSDQTAFFYMGNLIEMGKTNTIFTNPVQKQTEDYITGRFG